MGEAFIVGIITSVIGGIIVTVMKPSSVWFRHFDGNVILWIGLVLVSLVIGVLMAIFCYYALMLALPRVIGLMPGFSALSKPLSIISAVGVGIVLSVLVYRNLIERL